MFIRHAFSVIYQTSSSKEFIEKHIAKMFLALLTQSVVSWRDRCGGLKVSFSLGGKVGFLVPGVTTDFTVDPFPDAGHSLKNLPNNISSLMKWQNEKLTNIIFIQQYCYNITLSYCFYHKELLLLLFSDSILLHSASAFFLFLHIIFIQSCKSFFFYWV